MRYFCCGFIEINVWEAKFLLSETIPYYFERTAKLKHQDDLYEWKPAFDWLPKVTYSVATIQQASLKCVPLISSTIKKVINNYLYTYRIWKHIYCKAKYFRAKITTFTASKNKIILGTEGNWAKTLC